jgi:RimJ/RimL family protein N-acetyltransferase
MALIDWLMPQISFTLDGPGIQLRPARRNDFAAWADLRARSAHHLQPFEPIWPADDLTKPAFARRLGAYEQDMERGLAYPFLIFARGTRPWSAGLRCHKSAAAWLKPARWAIGLACHLCAKALPAALWRPWRGMALSS